MYWKGLVKGGLSPRVRGNRRIQLTSSVVLGSIPACAGEPDLRGVMVCPGYGLSPRVRGNPTCAA